MNDIRGKPSDGPISRYINRRISVRITNFIVRHFSDINPTYITIVNTVVGLLASPLYIWGMPLYAGIVAQLSSILDGVDGEVARALKKVSNIGGLIDAILDRIVDIMLLIGIIHYLIVYMDIYDTINSVLYLITVSGWLMVSYLHARIEIADISLDLLNVPRIASRDVRIFIIFVGSVTGFVYSSLILTGLLCYLYLTLTVIIIVSGFTFRVG
jgi:CDP-L-myo-inositol myo-inositolphosphotransferase